MCGRAVPVKADEDAGLYVAEARVKDGSKSSGKKVHELYPLANDNDIAVIGLIRRGKRLPGFSRNETLAKGDFLVLEGDPKSIEAFMGAADLDFSGSEKHAGGVAGSSLMLIEAIVPEIRRCVLLRRGAVAASMRQVPVVVVTVGMFEEAGGRKGATRMPEV